MFAKGCHLFAQVVKLTVIASEPFVLPIIPVSSGRGGEVPEHTVELRTRTDVIPLKPAWRGGGGRWRNAVPWCSVPQKVLTVPLVSLGALLQYL